MPRYYCDYCDTYLTHDSPSVRKQHNAGYKHKANVRTYYQQYEAQLHQSLIDLKVKEHLAYRQVAPQYSIRPGPPALPTLQMPMPAPMYNPLMQGMRPPPVLPRPSPGAPDYTMPQMMASPIAPPPPGQLNSLPRPVINAPPPPPPAMAPSSAGMPTSIGAPPMFTPTHQGNMAAAAPPPVSRDESSEGNPHTAEANN